MNRSIPKGSGLEFIDVKPLNPLISRCHIKVLYTGKNRNKSFISKEVATKMANTLPGVAIIGQYLYEAGDYGDHGEEELVIDKHGVRFIKDTVPYGFVPPNAKVWWANFLDNDGITREYLVTEGYLWTGRYPESLRIIEKGNPQSMELDRETIVGEWSKVEGQWAKFENDSEEYFIVSDAVFSGLCILGEDVEPCFEGASITKDSNLIYSLNKDDFKERMLDFMDDLKFALKDFNCEGGTENMDGITNILNPEENQIVEPVADPEVNENTDSTEDEFARKKKNEEDSKDNQEDAPSNDEDTNPNDEEDEEEKKKKKSKYSLEDVTEYQELLVKFNNLENKYNLVSNELEAIKPEFNELRQLKVNVENKAKDDMINSFYMLSDADKKEIIENKENYTLEQIESKLSVICVRNKVNFNLDDNSESKNNTETPITTFNVDNTFDTTPAWVKAVARMAEKRK